MFECLTSVEKCLGHQDPALPHATWRAKRAKKDLATSGRLHVTKTQKPSHKLLGIDMRDGDHRGISVFEFHRETALCVRDVE